VDYAKVRSSFGRPIGANQSIAFKLADLAVAVEAARLLTYRASWLRDSGQPFKHAAAQAKLFASETAVDATRIATQVFGGAGVMEGVAVSRFYRDAKILEIGEGTSEIQRTVIARGLGLGV
jgi:butyryl-CoA dehydrogenase